jgi:hypothetical protein
MLAMPSWSCESEEGTQTFQETELNFLALLLRRASVKVDQQTAAEEQSSFFLAAGKYFQASWAELDALGSTGLLMDEIPVALHVARHAGVNSGEVVDHRLRGESWGDILSRYYVTPESYYVPLASGVRLPSTRPDRYHRKSAREAWRRQRFSDDDIVNLINVKLLTDFYGITPDKIIALRDAGWTFIQIHYGIRIVGHRGADFGTPS